MPIIITSKKHLFRRCGVAHPVEPTTYPDGRFTDSELEILKADPMLRVEQIESTESTEEKETPDPVAIVPPVVKKTKKG